MALHYGEGAVELFGEYDADEAVRQGHAANESWKWAAQVFSLGTCNLTELNGLRYQNASHKRCNLTRFRVKVSSFEACCYI